MLILDTPYNGALLRQYNHCTQDAHSTRSSTSASRHADTAIALRGISITTAAHALRFYTESRNTLNILIVISTIDQYA